MTTETSTYAERPDLLERTPEPTEIWPEYNLHGDVLSRYWDRLWEDHPQCQVFIHDGAEVLVECNTVPWRWDGTVEGLPAGIDAVLSAAFEAPGGADTLCALAAQVRPSARGRGLSTTALQVMRDVAVQLGLRSLIAPVRPSWKERYPLTSIDEYVTWRRADGLLLDPWMRVHERLGARLLATCERSLQITAPVADWEGWTGMDFPATGSYVFPRGLALLHVDRDDDIGSYWEPNVWFAHDVSAG